MTVVTDAPRRAEDTSAPAATAASPTPEVTMTSGIRGLLPFARSARWMFTVSGVLAAASGLCALIPFWAIYRSIDLVVTGTAERSEMLRLAGIAAVGVIGRFLPMGLALWISHLAAYRVLYAIRIGMAEHLGRVPLGTVTSRRSGDLKKVMGDDVERLELFLAHGIPDLINAVVALAAVPIWLAFVDWRMALATMILVVPAVVCLSVAMRTGMDHMPEYHRTLGTMNASIVELVRGMPVVKVFNRASDRVRDAERAVDEHVAVVRRYSRAFLPLGTLYFVLLTANVLLIVPLGVWLHSNGTLGTSELLFFFVLGLGALAPVVSLLHLFAQLSHISSGGNLVNEVLAQATLTDEGADQRPEGSSVEFRDVTFSYGATPVLHRVSFRTQPGTLTALVGPSGAGKSTIAALVARFWDADSGAVIVGGADVRRMTADDLSRHVAVVLQDTFLFDDTIAGNLRVARCDATDKEIEAVARAARAHDFVSALPEGYDTVVGERGARLSGGERQRLTLARAILADTPVVVLDEATSFADPENEALIQEGITNLVRGRTVLMIAHRLSTVVGADQILVVDGGRIVESGTHDELLAGGGLYSTLWDDFTAAESMALGEAVHRTDEGGER